MILKDKTFVITGILTDKSIAFAAAKIAIDNGARIIATGFGDGLRITKRAVKRLDAEIDVLEMDIENIVQVQEVVNQIKDKTFVITGILTDKSIAFAAAKIAIDNGAKIIATGFGDGLRITKRAVKRLDAEIDVLEMDIENTVQVQEVVNQIKDKHESIDGALHAIALSPTEAMGGNFLNTNVEDAIKSFEVSAFSLKTLTNEFLPILKEGASIVAVDFDNSQAWPGYDWQGVAKSSLQSIVRYLAFYVGKNKVRVNAVASGPLSTTAAKNIPGFSAMNDEWNERAPLGWDTKNAEPVAKVINFLLSDYSEAITGEIIHVDGGAHAIGGSMLPD